MHATTAVSRNVRHYTRQAGLTLVEAMVALGVSAVVAGTAVPGFQASIALRDLDGVAAQMETDIALARSAAVAANRTLRISFGNDATGTCYVVHSGSAGDCVCSGDGLPVCTGSALAWRSVSLPSGRPVSLTSNVRSMLIDPDKGTVTPTGTVRVAGNSGKGVNVVVNIMGRVRQCTPTPPLTGYRSC